MSTPTVLSSMPSGGRGEVSPSLKKNSHRMAVVVEKLANALSAQVGDATWFSNLCLSLSRTIDYAVANNDKPSCAPGLPLILKQVCQHNKDNNLQAAVMVLLISVKRACEVGWFSSMESKELLVLVDEVGSCFCTPRVPSHDQTSILSFVSQIMSRFYPLLKLGHIFASLDVKSGFGAHLVDFCITTDIPRNQKKEIRLLVARIDNMDTSSCIISPNEVNFIINGISVGRRPNITMDLGPQLPAVVEHAIRYGVNLLQAVGQFDGHYVILLACLSFMPMSELPAPPNYVQTARAAVDSDADIIEGPSRINLTCPIRFQRIKIPAKGHMCKHHQCFDLTNYVEMNMKRPSWRCPHCNQFICYTDIRIDQSMLKILQEVEENVVEVIISEDGSWKAISSTNDQNNEPNVRSSASPEGAEQQETLSGSLHAPCNIYDLTEGDDDIKYVHESIDTKPILQPDSQNTSTSMNLTVELDPRTSEAGRSSAYTQVEGVFSSGLPSGQADSTSVTIPQQVGSLSGYMFGNFTPSPLFADSASPAPKQGQEAFQDTNFPSNPMSMSQRPIAVNNNLQWQQSQLPQSVMSNDYGIGRYSAICRDVSRIPNAIQALPIQMPAPNAGLSQTSGPFVRNFVGNGSSHPTRTAVSSQSIAVGSGPSRSDLLQQQYISQPMLHRRAASQVPRTGFQISSGLGASHQINPVNQVLPSMVSPPPHLRSSRVPQAQIQPMVSLSGTVDQATPVSQQHYWHMVSHAQQAALRPRQQQTVPVQFQTSRPASFLSHMNPGNTRTGLGEHGPSSAAAVQSVTRMEDLLDVQAERNWRPSGRMRGSLSGQAYSDALSQFMIRPTQMGQASLPNSVGPP